MLSGCRALGLIAATALVASGCAGQQQGGSAVPSVPVAAGPAAPVAVATTAAPAAAVSRRVPAARRDVPATCGRAAANGIAGFFAALSVGRVGRAERYVTTDGFVWFVLGAVDRRAGTPPATLAANRTVWFRWKLGAYLRRRALQHDRFTLDSLVVGSDDGGRVGFQLAAYRSADDLAARRRLPLVAKGEWMCGPGLIRGLVGHADLRGGQLLAKYRCPANAERVAGARVC